MKSEDLLATVFPDQVACLENIVGEREVPDHPLVAQTLSDCSTRPWTSTAWKPCCGRSSAARWRSWHATSRALALRRRDPQRAAPAPSSTMRRWRSAAQAVIGRGYVDPATAGDFGHLDAEAIAAVRGEAWPQVRGVGNARRMLMSLGFVTAAEVAQEADWAPWLDALVAQGRAARWLPAPDRALWLCAERLPQFQAPHAGVTSQTAAGAARILPGQLDGRGRPGGVAARAPVRFGPVRADALAASLALPAGDVAIALARLERDGYACRAATAPLHSPRPRTRRQSSGAIAHLLARIHRYTVGRLRREIEPVEPRDYLRLVDWQHLGADAHLSGPDGLAAVLAQLEGWEAPAGAWESELLPARVAGYDIAWLDDLCRSGRIAWTRLPADRRPARKAPAARRPCAPARWCCCRGVSSPVARPRSAADASAPLGSRAQRGRLAGAARRLVLRRTARRHAPAADRAGRRPANSWPRAACTPTASPACAPLLVPSSQRPAAGRRRGGRRGALFGIADAGRWALAQRGAIEAPTPAQWPNATSTWRRAAAPLRRGAGECSNARPPGCRPGASCAASTTAWRRGRNPRRPLHRRHRRRAVRPARGRGQPAPRRASAPPTALRLRLRRRSAEPRRQRARRSACPRSPRRVLYRDGVPLATLVAGEVTPLQTLDESTVRQVRVALQRETHAAPAAAQPTQ